MGRARETTWLAKINTIAVPSSKSPKAASSATLVSKASTKAIEPNAPMRESFMISKARSRSYDPPSPSLKSAKPSS